MAAMRTGGANGWLAFSINVSWANESFTESGAACDDTNASSTSGYHVYLRLMT
jgi:hypothetical protein